MNEQLLNNDLIALNNYLSHSGRPGMKWRTFGASGATRWQPGAVYAKGMTNPNDNPLSKSKTNNLDSWGKTEDTNVLYITGYSGSGKSTIANKLADKNTSVIHLDSYFDNPDGPHDKVFDAYLQKNLPEYKKLSWPKDKISLQDWGKVCEKFEVEVEKFGKDQFKNRRKVICEGVQLLDDTMRPDKSYFKDKPVAVVSTNALVSIHRADMRDNYKYQSPKDVINTVNDYINSYKEISTFRKMSGIKSHKSNSEYLSLFNNAKNRV